jgi:hypothetical protein
MSRLDAPLQPVNPNLLKAHLGALPIAVKERLEARGFEGSIALSFDEPAAAGAEIVTRSHPIPATLAESLLESALDPGSAPVSPLGRTGAWPTAAVQSVTTVFLLRLRYKLTVHGRRERLLLVEEAGAAAFEAASCMSSEPFGQVSNGFKREYGPSELKFRLQSGDAAGVVARWS